MTPLARAQKILAKRRQPMVGLTWVDSGMHVEPWCERKASLRKKAMECESAGYLLKATKNVMIICHSLTKDQCGGVLHIPTAAVTSVTEIRA